MLTSVTAEDAAGRLPALLARVDRGDHVVITSGGRPVAELVPAGMSPVLPRQASADLRNSLLTGSESMNDLSLPLPRF